jgi:hypothetical protein
MRSNMAKYALELVPFTVPTYVTVKREPGRREDGFRPPIELKLSELDAETLDELCTEFRKSVFKAAGYNG